MLGKIALNAVLHGRPRFQDLEIVKLVRAAFAAGAALSHLSLVWSIDACAQRVQAPAGSSNSKLKTEARLLESWHGKNLYSDFLLKHDQRPDKQQAKIISQLMDARLLDSGGQLQPPPSKSELAVSKAGRVKKQLKVQSWQALASIEHLSQLLYIEPSQIAAHSGRFSSCASTRSQVKAAIEWLARIDSELLARESEEAV